MERLVQRERPAWWWSQGFLMLIIGMFISIFVAPTAHAADDTFSVVNDKITITSGAFYGGSYTEGTADIKVQCSPTTSVGATVTINQEDATKIKNGETLDTIRYTLTPNDSTGGSCPEGERTAQNSSSTAAEEETESSCEIDGFGWLVCAPSRWFGNAMDWAYRMILQDFLETQPLEITNTNSVIYQAWDIVRGFANAMFIIGFLVIVYSQITSVGLNNYGIKKLAPRLVIAAILVNLSYYICAIGIDLSNILGYAIKDFLDSTLSTILNGATIQLDSGELIAKTLSGAALTVAGVTLAKGALLAAAPLILPTLLMLFLSIIVALLVLSVRQALIIILIIIAPLAFVAYLLPGTEKWFEKWRNVFFTMLIFFPAFAFVFGGANMAGTIISMTAGDSVIRYILGWIVQFAPLAITPLIMKLGGGVLNRFAGIVNNPSKGLVDRSKQWADKKSKQIGQDRAFGNNNLKPRHFLRRAARRSYQQGKLMDDRIAEGEKRSENLHHDTAAYKNLSIRTRQTTDQGVLLDSLAENRYNEMKSGKVPTALNTSSEKKQQQLQERAVAIRALYNNNTANKISQENTARALSDQFSDDMLKDQQLQRQAKGLYEFGVDVAKASATATQRSNFGKSVGENAELMKHFKLSSEQRQNLLRGIDQTVTDEKGAVLHTFTANNAYAVEAALNEQMTVGTVSQVKEIVAMSGSGQHLAEYRGTISEGLAKSGSGKAAFFGGKIIDEVYQGNITGEGALKDYVVSWIGGGKFKPVAVSNFDKEALELLQSSIGPAGSPQRSTIGTDRLVGLRKKINAVFSSPELSANVADNALTEFKKLRDSLPPLPPESDGTVPKEPNI